MPNWRDSTIPDSNLTDIDLEIRRAVQSDRDAADFGAKGDGVTDDTVAIQSALDSLGSNGGTVLLPVGVYKITTPLNISRTGTVLAGEGWGSQLVYDGSVVSPLLSASSLVKPFMRDLRLSQSNASSVGTCIDASNFNGGITERVLIDAAVNGAAPNIGIDFNGVSGFYHAVSDSRINVAGANAIGIRFTNGSNSHVVRNCRIIPSASDASNVGVKVDATSIELDRVDIENAAGTAIQITASGHACSIIAPYLELNGTNISIAAGAVAPLVIGGTNESATTANLTDAGSLGATILGVRNSSVPYNHGAANTLRVPDNVIQPADHGLAAWAFDPACISNGTLLIGGTAYFVKIPIRYSVTVSKVWFIVTAAAVTPTSGQSFFALYSSAGVLLASADASSVITTTGPQSVTIASQALTPGYVLACVMCNAGTLPTIARNTGAAGYGNVNLSTANLRFFSNTTGNTTSVPTPLTLSSNTTANAGTQDFWAGLS